MNKVIILLGSNIDREQNIHRAITALRNHPDLTLLGQSSVYKSDAVGPEGNPMDQEPYHNCAVLLQTDLSPEKVHSMLRAMEASFGRVRTDDKFAARTLDLDLILYGEETVAVNGKYIPDIDEFRFAHVAQPVAEVAPARTLPGTDLTFKSIATQLAPTKLEIRKL